MNKKIYLSLLSIFYFLLTKFVFALQAPQQALQQLPPIIIPVPSVPGQGLTIARIANYIAIISSSLTSIGLLIAIIAIIWSGLMYMKAGANPEQIKKAQSWLKNSLLGALIVLGVNLIINTIANIISGAFFCRLLVFGRCIF